ncbi:hypothetical protein [Kineococcus indalonis]|nr:hypothetical protein [Kineococcus indalonis]NAZ85919.1 hypothetical protein [Kineococcus indalonis]
MSTGPHEGTRLPDQDDAVQTSTDDLVDEAFDTDDEDAPSEPLGDTHTP